MTLDELIVDEAPAGYALDGQGPIGADLMLPAPWNRPATDVRPDVMRSQGFEVGEVAGACFCCNFNELTATVDRLAADQRPDIVLAEPVGTEMREDRAGAGFMHGSGGASNHAGRFSSGPTGSVSPGPRKLP